MVRSLLVVALVGVVGPGIAAAQPWVTYTATPSTLPQAQCWTHREDLNPVMAYPLGVAAGNLHLSTLGLAATGAAGGGVWWERSDVTINFSSDFAVEASVWIAAAPNHSVNTSTGWPRPGYAVVVFDVNGRVFWIGLGTSEIFLSNTSYGAYGSPNTVTTAFDTTDAHHVYRIERAAGGVGATLKIDGVQRLTLPALGPSENTGALVYFGDPTYWANSDSYTSFVRYSGVDTGPITGLTGPSSASTCVTGAPMFTVAVAPTNGSYSYRWQWRPQGTAAWLDVVNGVNTNPGTVQPAFDATAVTSVSVTMTNSVGVSMAVSGGRREIQVVVTNPCGSATSSVATWTICPPDFNCSGSLTIQDIFDFLAAWFAGNPAANFNGVNGIAIQDIFDFLAAWFAGC